MYYRTYASVPLIRHPFLDPREYSVQLFRRTFTVPQPAEGTAVWVTACQRFELYLDGGLLARGPSRSDPTRWHVSCLRLPPVDAGDHVLAARVVNWADHAGIGQLGDEAFFLLAAHDEVSYAAGLITSTAWRCAVDRSVTPIDEPCWMGETPYYVAGCSDRVDTARAMPGWTSSDFDDSQWHQATEIAPRWQNPWGRYPGEVILRDDPLPQMQETTHEWARGNQFPAAIDSETTVELLLDTGILMNAWPEIEVHGGDGGCITCIWSEAPYDRTGIKHPRDRWELASYCGPVDEFALDGRDHRLTTTWYRSFRYLHLTIRGGTTPLTITNVSLRRTAFPLARPELPPESGPSLTKEDRVRLWEASWETVRNCAHETIMDCPHYEQAQFPGDSRVQAIYHYSICGEYRLGLKAIDDLHASQIPEGIIQCRYPSRQVQIIPTFGLYWIMMLEDYVRFSGDAGSVARFVPTANGVLAWYQRLARSDGLLGLVPHAPFIDWSPDFPAGNAPQTANGGSSILTSLLSRTCRSFCRLLEQLDESCLAEAYNAHADRHAEAVRELCLDAATGLVADCAGSSQYSQHAQIEAVLAGVISGSAAERLLAESLSNTRLTQIGTFYYRFYQIEALLRYQMVTEVEQLLGRWTATLEREQLGTFPETERPNPRSDNHAWALTPALVLAGVRWW